MNRIKRWQRTVGGLAAALLLIPVPAMAGLSFSGTQWTAVSNSQSGGPTPPMATFTDTLNSANQEDDLFVNMGNYSGATATAKSSIELQRGINLSTSKQLVEFEQEFSAQFEQAGMSLSVAVLDSHGKNVQTPLSFSFSTNSSSFTPVTVKEANINNELKAGNYTLDVKVSYNTNNKIGAWKSISPFHHFEFEGL
jgi:hypothetical protein